MDLFRETSPWYTAGLAFECTGCGRCCSGPEEGYVWADDAEIDAVAAFLGIDPAQMRSRYVRNVGRRKSLKERRPGNDCIFLEADPAGGRICRIYAVRPRQCRTWPFWPYNIHSPRRWTDEAMRCPGINRGAGLFTREEIEARAKATHE